MSTQQTGTIRKQVQLPLSVAFRISLLNIRVRFLRALITAAGVMLGIAFFTAVRAAALYAPPIDPNDPAALETATRQTWLVVMSLLMSTVGISNSMLMAVTERYKEIGTMKCLGALDSFVVKLFFLEAGMLGIAFFTAVRAAALYAPPIDPNDPAALETATRQTWLVVMSLLMSTVGISNSMLMAVTERYKEIGTMKCLGALDSFVVKLFFLEAGMLGVVASAIGFLIGWGLVFIINLFRLGAGVWSAATPLELLALLGQAMAVGVVVTVVATILPAIRAAKMPPAAALRVEV